jgi:hypothetical protein
MLAGMPDSRFWDELVGPPSPPEQARARRRQQASEARFDHALDLVDQAADAAAKGDHGALRDLVARMDRVEFDDFEERHPPSAALEVQLSEIVDDLIPDDTDTDAGFGDTWVDHLVQQADLALPPPVARWVRLVVGMAAEEYQLSNAELEAIDRVRGGLHPDRDRDLAIWLAERDQRPRADVLCEGIQALAWLRAATW